jgi:AraC family transcriptional activator of pobA
MKRKSSNVKVYKTAAAFTKKFMPSEELQLLFKGDLNKFFIVPVQDMHRHVHRPVPPSRTTNYTFIFLTEGEAYMKIGSGEYTIYQNEMLFVPAGQIFSFEEHNADTFNKGYLCSFHQDLLTLKSNNKDLLNDFEFFKVWGNPCIKLNTETSSYVLNILKRISNIYAAVGITKIEIIQAYLIALFYELNNVYQPTEQSRQPAAIHLTNQFKDLLFKNVTSKHLVSYYAALLNVSPNHLNKVVKLVTHKSPTVWIDEAIILEAKVLLYQTQTSISEIAAKVGIYDPSYFSRLFKRYEGVTPIAFRKKIETS